MKLARAAVLIVMLGAAGAAALVAQSSTPNLTRAQRNALRAVVAAVDAPGERPQTPDSEWPLHVLRASDGSHYVAFSVAAPPGTKAGQPVVLYVRLATRGSTLVAERSAVAEWLAGQRSTPLKKERGFAFGDMPTFGAGAIAARGPGPQSLQILEADRERARARREEEERERKATLEGAAAARGPNPLLPFEDFDAAVVLTADAAGRVMLRRSLTAGPGDYDLTVAWADPAARDLTAATQIRRRTVQLPIASTTAFDLSSVVLADDVSVREAPYPADQQTAHPYSIGTMEISPAQDQLLTNDERLALVVQVINPRAAADGKPDVAVGFRLFRTTGAGQESVGTLTPQIYNAVTLPPDFDAAKGHPIFAAVAIPLKTFKRGTYRVQVMADDRLAGVSSTNDATFTIVGTPTALLRDAPPLAPPFRRDAILSPPILDAIADALQQPVPSTAFAQGLDALRAGRFVDLVRADAVNAPEQGPRELLRAIGLFALGDTTTAVAAPLRQATQLATPAAATTVVAAALRALDGAEREALTAWRGSEGAIGRALAPLLSESHLRLGEAQEALDVATAALKGQPNDQRLVRCVAAAHLALGREAEALAVLDAHLARQPEDVESQWLLLQALFSGVVQGRGAGSTDAGRQRLRDVAQTYVAAKGRHAALASEWADASR